MDGCLLASSLGRCDFNVKTLGLTWFCCLSVPCGQSDLGYRNLG